MGQIINEENMFASDVRRKNFLAIFTPVAHQRTEGLLPLLGAAVVAQWSDSCCCRHFDKKLNVGPRYWIIFVTKTMTKCRTQEKI